MWRFLSSSFANTVTLLEVQICRVILAGQALLVIMKPAPEGSLPLADDLCPFPVSLLEAARTFRQQCEAPACGVFPAHPRAALSFCWKDYRDCQGISFAVQSLRVTVMPAMQ